MRGAGDQNGVMTRAGGVTGGARPIEVVLVHGIRTSATMWRSQVAHLTGLGIDARAVDLPGHGTRRGEEFTIEGAFATIDETVQDASTRGDVLLVGHSMGGLLCLEYAGRVESPPIAGLVAASCTALPRGLALRTYRSLARTFDRLPDRGLAISRRVLGSTLPPETLDDFEAGGYALDAQDVALASLSSLDLAAAVTRIAVPLWFVNGQYDQLRVNERLFRRLAPRAELIVVPRTSHLVTAMRPRVFNALLDVALATLRAAGPAA